MLLKLYQVNWTKKSWLKKECYATFYLDLCIYLDEMKIVSGRPSTQGIAQTLLYIYKRPTNFPKNKRKQEIERKMSTKIRTTVKIMHELCHFWVVSPVFKGVVGG